MRLLILILFFFGCGREDPHIKYVNAPPTQTPPSQPPNPGNGGGSDQVTFAEMQGLLDTYCSQCHASSPFMQSEANLKRSTAKDRIWSRNMPPNNAANPLGESDRKRMLLFFQ
jgi:hypothetical protein